MNAAIQSFMTARERYLQLETARTQARTPEERELVDAELVNAWLEVHYYAQIVTGVRFTEGMEFAKEN